MLAGIFGLVGGVASPLRRYLLPLGAAFGLFWLLFQLAPEPPPLVSALWLTLLLALNTVPTRWLYKWLSTRPISRAADIIFVLVFGLAELILFKLFIGWLLRHWRGDEALMVLEDRRFLNRLPALLLVPAIAALSFSAYSLADLHRTLFPDGAVQMFASGNFNDLELNLEQRVLYVSGHGLNYIQAYHLDALEQPPRQSPVATGYAQSFGYNSRDHELYVYNQETQQLLVLDGATLTLKRAIPTPQVSPGDAWLVWDQFSDNIIIASEADEWQGFPFIVVKRTTGQVVDAANIESGNIMLHPTKPLLYLGFFRRGSEILVYDTQQLEIVRRAPADEHLNRLAFVPDETDGELLIASPVDSQVLRFNAETLEYKSAISSLFGVRTIAVDPLRHLLVAGSLATNRVEVIDLASQQRLAEFYIGPWLRTISLDTGTGLAYISTHEGLFTVQYTVPK
jgi:hypothetical protein